jgi:N-methylhydantoinase A
VPVQFPAIDVSTIGAGGGTIAWIDKAGTLRSGPQSAGARPGPAAYGSGGEEPTNTDANLVLGRLDPGNFLGGEFRLRRDLAHDAIRRRIADPLGLSVEDAAEGILRVSNENMVEALRLVSVERGNDPRDYALIAFGGAGPVHGAHCAAEMNIPTVIVPRSPGLASAFGQLRVEIRDDTQRPLLKKHTEIEPDELERVFRDLEEQARELLREEGIGSDQAQLQRSVDVKYYPQTSYINLRLDIGPVDQATIDDLIQTFLQRHADEFGYSVGLDQTSVEFVNARLTALAPAPVGELPTDPRTGVVADAVRGQREVHFAEAAGWVSTAVYDRSRLFADAAFDGPAVVQEADSTTVVPPGAHLRVDDYRNLILDVREVARV